MQYKAIIPYIVQKHNTKQQNNKENFDKKISPVKALRVVVYLSTVKLPIRSRAKINFYALTENTFLSILILKVRNCSLGGPEAEDPCCPVGAAT
ncbi:MAG: hypothetical protein IJI21_07480, partial [Clostridia bacterium]|nr:hypothetical protein [Clostridia bacterium]